MLTFGVLVTWGREIVEIRALDRLSMADLRGDVHGRRAEAHLGTVILAELGGELAVGHLDSVELLEEVDMEEGAAEFPVGDALQADGFLLPHHLGDAAVIDGAQRGGVDLAVEMLRARLREFGRAQVAADMVGAEWRSSGHVSSPLWFPVGHGDRFRENAVRGLDRQEPARG